MEERIIEMIEKRIFFRCVEYSTEALMITDADSRLLWVNQAWQRIYGYSMDEILGETPRILRSSHQDDNFYRAMWADVLEKGFWRGEIVNRAKSGREVPVLLTINPYKSEEGVIEGFLGIAVDMTEKKQLEAQILQADRLASIGLLASGLAHEIGTPLGVIRGRAEYLQQIARNNETVAKGMDVIITQIDRISKLIYSLLNLARSDKSEAARPVNVLRACQDVHNLVEQKTQKSSVALCCEIPDHATVQAESDKLIQVLLNLVMNALHAVEKRLRAQPAPPGKIRISASEHPDTWIVTVEDNGTGISRANLRLLFKPFFTTKDPGEGTGLGLAITERIIQSWGGSVSVESTEGSGTRFHLTLPKGQIKL
ncbi:MAG: PAS domain S-box protein [Bdellovibrionales bacterium]|nr:PAS domain S-box protein [Bdellovibrionales bacterium]